MPWAEKMSEALSGTSSTSSTKTRALVAELVDDVAVVDDLLADVDGAVDDLEGLLDDVDGADHAGAEAAQPRDEELLDADLGKVARRGHQFTVSANFFSFLRGSAPWPAPVSERERSGKVVSTVSTTPSTSSLRLWRCCSCGL